uniref:Uncharacterized protein n=1 Tax=Panagrolaimus davidi TaxID=227884 RepID=A0A914QVW9_9BILA
MKNLQEPMLYAHDNNLYPIGTVDNDTNAGETTATKLHVSECNCKGSKKNKKVWMCVACKRFLFETLENNEWLKCNCGFHIISKLDKRCVCCSVKRKISRVVPIT